MEPRPFQFGNGLDLRARLEPHIDLSVVIPVYNEESNIDPLVGRLTRVLKGMGLAAEIIFVDDGSSDRSVDMLYAKIEQGLPIKVIRLGRNFGHQIAISAGIQHTSGETVAIMDGDLQDPPEVLPQLINKLHEGYDVVYGVRQKRKESVLKRAAYATFYRLLKQVSSIDIPLDAGDFCVMKRRVVGLLCEMPERNRFVRGIRSWVGLRQVGLEYERDARLSGTPKYTVSKLFMLALNGVFSFSLLPLRIASYAGLAVSAGAFALAALYLGRTIFVGRIQPPGFATNVILTLFVGGVQLMALGIAGEYLGRVYDEVRQRPLYTVLETRGFANHLSCESEALGILLPELSSSKVSPIAAATYPASRPQFDVLQDQVSA